MLIALLFKKQQAKQKRGKHVRQTNRNTCDKHAKISCRCHCPRLSFQGERRSRTCLLPVVNHPSTFSSQPCPGTSPKLFIQDLFVWECMSIHEAPNFMSIAPGMVWVSFTVAVFAPRSLEKPCWRSQMPTTRRLRYVGGSSVYRGHSRALGPRILLAVGVITEVI